MKLSIAFITYNDSTFKYLPYFLESLKESLLFCQKGHINVFFDFLVFDNSTDGLNKNKEHCQEFFKKNNFSFNIFSNNSNIGFAKAYNKMMNYAYNNSTDLFLVVNPDVIFSENFFIELLKAQIEFSDAAVLCPKILYWDFVNNKKTNIIDSYGVCLTKSHYFFDLGQGQDSLSFKFNKDKIFGFTGAGALFNLKNIKSVAMDNGSYLEFFDELMFMYKEDVDLSYRIRLLGLKIYFIENAIMYHDRSLSRVNLFNLLFSKKRDISRSRSLLNQLIVLYKIKEIPFSSSVKILSFFRLIKIFVYMFIFERKVFSDFLRILPNIKLKVDEEVIKKDNLEKIESIML